MRNLLIKLGLLKISQAEFFEMLEKLHNDISIMILKNKDLEREKYIKAICEIKIFFWVFAGPILMEYMNDEMCDRTMKFFRSDIIFSTINESKFPNEHISKLLSSRFEFHENGLRGNESGSVSDVYFRHLRTLWFEKPFGDIDEISSPAPMEFDVFKYTKNLAEIKLLYNHIVPVYSDSIKRLIKMTKK